MTLSRRVASTPAAFTALMCTAEVFGMLSFTAFQALIPDFRDAWGLDNTQAGWISGIYFAGYVAAVPLLTAITDRVDPKRIMLGSLALGIVGSAGFALFADGFWSALIFRTLQGIGLAGTYMPGLKALTDRIEGPTQSRHISFYTATFGLGAALSYIIAGEVTAVADWRWAFGAMALAAAVAFVLILVGLPASTVDREGSPDRRDHPLDFRPVFRNRRAMRYVFAYAGHNWELFAFRSWAVAYLVYAQGAAGSWDFWVNATTIAALATFLGTPSSILGNELALRLGRRRHVLLVTGCAMALAAVIGHLGSVSHGLAVALVLLYGVLAAGDSAAVTSGAVAAAEDGRRGQTLAVHSFIGFMGGIFGPLSVGVFLDLAGPGTSTGWGIAFLAVGFGSLIAFVAIWRRS